MGAVAGSNSLVAADVIPIAAQSGPVAPQTHALASASQAVASRPSQGAAGQERRTLATVGNETYAPGNLGRKSGEGRRAPRKSSQLKMHSRARRKTIFGDEGDRVMFMWIVKLWRVEVDRKKEESAARAAEDEKRRLEEERQRKIQE